MPESSDLGGRRIVVTRPKRQSEGLVCALEASGAVPILFPVMRIRPLEAVPGFDEALTSLERYGWVILTSANGVEVVWDCLARLGVSAAPLRTGRVAAIGPATAEALRERGVEPAFLPEAYVGDSLGEGLPDVSGARVLLARAEDSRAALPDILTRRGAQVDEFSVYRTVSEKLEPMAFDELRRGTDAVTFTSPSTVRHFVGALEGSGLNANDLPGGPLNACIGPITAKAAEQFGLKVGIVAGSYTSTGLVEAMLEHFRREGER